jgi:hypothetical protein
MIPERPKSTTNEERAAAADYVRSMAGTLALLARNHGLDTLGYLLEMARLEAENVAGSLLGK